jgi:hypothetical protein
MYVSNYEKQYENSEESKNLNMFDYGIKEIEKLIKYTKRGLIKKAEYNRQRKAVEEQLLKI